MTGEGDQHSMLDIVVERIAGPDGFEARVGQLIGIGSPTRLSDEPNCCFV